MIEALPEGTGVMAGLILVASALPTFLLIRARQARQFEAEVARLRAERLAAQQTAVAEETTDTVNTPSPAPTKSARKNEIFSPIKSFCLANGSEMVANV